VVATITIPYGVLMRFGLGTLWVAQDAPTTMSGGGEPAKMKPGQALPDRPHQRSGAGPAGPPPGTAPTALTVGEGAVWVGELDRKSLIRFNLVS